MRWFITATRATNFADAKMRSTSVALASGSAFGPGQSTAILPGACGHNCGAPSLERLARVDDRRQLLIFDLDEFAGVLRRRARLGDHHRHRLADMHARVRWRAPAGTAG